ACLFACSAAICALPSFPTRRSSDLAFDLRRVEADHFASRTRQLDTGFLSEQVTDKAAAIETGLDGLAAITVRRTDQGEAALEDAVGQRRQFVALFVSQFTQLLLAGLVRLRLHFFCRVVHASDQLFEVQLDFLGHPGAFLLLRLSGTSRQQQSER